MSTPFFPQGRALGIGSLPHLDPAAGLALVLQTMPQSPHWPQFPKASMYEQMELQVTEGLPCVVVNEEDRRVFFDTSGDPIPAVEKFYEHYLEAEAGGPMEDFAISRRSAAGLYLLEEALAGGAYAPELVKGQIIGPFSLGMSLFDETRRPILYHDLLGDVVVKGLAMKAVWQAKKLLGMGGRAFLFVDEPVLASFGSSAMITISREEVIAKFNEVINGVKALDVVTGSHCCGNTDWAMLMETEVDVVSFDAFNYMETMTLYPAALQRFFDRGGALAWGIVPNVPEVMDMDVAFLLQRLTAGVAGLTAKGLDQDLIYERMFITPACGTGTLSLDQAEQVYSLTRQISDSVRAR
ncbi:MAG: hypothetical protein HQK60_17225 [Deltaproteobacteria bacterium]|nr:hypothetical protein [Deltaproteobacteria bacterium]